MTDDGHDAARVSLAREEGFRFRVRFGADGVPAIVTDEAPPLGKGAGPNPTALLAAAVGNCLAASLLFCMQKAHLEVSDFEAEVSTTLARDPGGRLRIGAMRVCLAPTVSAEVRGRMGRCMELFEDFCTVTQSVRRGIEVTVAVEPRTSSADERPAPLARPPCAAIGGR
jgi:organic hydroperoxide reductase OsmC/OhrA